MTQTPDDTSPTYRVNDLLFKGKKKRSIIAILEKEYDIKEIKKAIRASSIPHILNFVYISGLMGMIFILQNFLLLLKEDVYFWDIIPQLLESIPSAIPYFVAYYIVNKRKGISLQKISVYSIVFYHAVTSILAFTYMLQSNAKSAGGIGLIPLFANYVFIRAMISFNDYKSWYELRFAN